MVYISDRADGLQIIDSATKYCEGAPSISAFFAEMGGKAISLFSCRINSPVLGIVIHPVAAAV
jgi:hypothetical protein